DVVQETLMRAWRKLERFEHRAAIDTWLYRIATNACLDELERRPRRPEPVDPYPDERLAAAETPIVDPAARYAAREGVELAFLTAIQRLPGRQRAILILRDVLGWTAPEVADLLESTVAAVNSGLQRARATIDAELPASSRTAAAPSQRELLADYVDAWERVDIDGLVSLLREDAVLRMPPKRAIVGAGEIGEFFDLGPCGGGTRVTTVAPTWANGRPAVVMRRRLADGRPRRTGCWCSRWEAAPWWGWTRSSTRGWSSCSRGSRAAAATSPAVAFRATARSRPFVHRLKPPSTTRACPVT
ncbi:MAG: sigma-70 family RNA polymerase sigma factor, partial [Solirubrobacterales bacterium]|nr:sigma-70 family RNA polymerase sigma factor [Solirubrobacterales bacterium]